MEELILVIELHGGQILNPQIRLTELLVGTVFDRGKGDGLTGIDSSLTIPMHLEALTKLAPRRMKEHSGNAGLLLVSKEKFQPIGMRLNFQHGL